MHVSARKLFGRFTYANVMSTLAVGLLIGGGTAYAANTIGSADIIDNSILTADIKTSEVKSGDIANGNVKNLDIGSGAVSSASVLNESLTSDDFAKIEKWHYIGAPGEPAFENGWTNYDSSPNPNAATWQHAAYAKDSFGFVHLRGMIAGGTIGQTAFRLPAGYCPWYYHAYGVVADNAFSRVTVTWLTEVDNSCWVSVDTGLNAWVSLEGVTFQEYALESRVRPGASSATGATAVAPGSAPIHGPARKELNR